MKTDKDLKFNGSNNKYNLNVNQIYLTDQNSVQNTLNTGEYSAIYVVPKGYAKNQVDGMSDFINEKITKLSKNLLQPNYLKQNPNIEKTIFKGLDNFVKTVSKNITPTNPISQNQKALFDLLNFFIRNSRINTAALVKYKTAGISENDLKMLDKALTTITKKPYDDKEMNLSKMIGDLKTY
jgi:hypothetical protein